MGIRLNLGCGRNLVDGLINVDIPQEGHNPDKILDLNEASLEDWKRMLDIHESSDLDLDKTGVVEYAQLIHVIEHIPHHLKMMENLWHVMEPNGVVYIRCPHGASDDAWEDPTHVRPIFPGSFMYYSQPTYWRADYGYRGDFRVVRAKLIVSQPNFLKKTDFAIMTRNSVSEIVVTMQAIKPIRPPLRELMEQIPVQLVAPENTQPFEGLQSGEPE